MTLSLLQEMFKLFFFALIVYISYNSKITRDKIFRLFFWIPIATTYIGSALIQTDFRDFGVILLVLSLISVLFVYGLHFLKREKELLDYLKIFWLLLIVADLAMVNLFRFFSNKSINQSLDFTNCNYSSRFITFQNLPSINITTTYADKFQLPVLSFN